MLNALLAGLILVLISVISAKENTEPSIKTVQRPQLFTDTDIDILKRSIPYDPLTFLKRANPERSYYSLDTLGGIGLGKRSGPSMNMNRLSSMGFHDDPRFKKAFASLDSLGGMGLGKRSAGIYDSKRDSFNYFDSLGGIGLGK